VNSIYLVVGSHGVVGSQVTQRLRSQGKLVATKSSSEILQASNSSDLAETVSPFVDNSIDLQNSRVGLILAHRYRGNDIQRALNIELCITRDFVWGLSKLCESLRVVVLGSVAGRLVDKKLPEAYHYSKDLQKTIARQSVRISNIHMNVLELSWFEKYPKHKATDDYRNIMANLRQHLGGDCLPTVDSITDFSSALIEMHHPPRGQTIVYDGGISLSQNG
jgi:hypothetical protein